MKKGVLFLIEFKRGNIFNDFDKVDAIINTVNCVGVMGKGVAKEFAIRFPKLLGEYKIKCKTKDLDIGKNYVYEIPNYNETRFIVNFPTKKHWRNDSKLEYIEKGLDDLVKVITDFEIKSIVMPALGCGNGNLDWNDVKPLITEKMSSLKDVNIIIYEPTLKANNDTKIKVSKPRLTKDRKILLVLMDTYNKTKNNPKITYKEINALAYIMHYNNSKIKFELKPYGPYSQSINPIITNLAKYYIRPIEKQEDNDATPIDIVTLDFPQKSLLLKDKDFIKVKEFLNGFESKDNLRILTICLWIYYEKKTFDEELFTLTVEWLTNNNYSFDKSHIRKAVTRIEKTFRTIDVLSFDF